MGLQSQANEGVMNSLHPEKFGEGGGGRGEFQLILYSCSDQGLSVGLECHRDPYFAPVFVLV